MGLTTICSIFRKWLHVKICTFFDFCEQFFDFSFRVSELPPHLKLFHKGPLHVKVISALKLFTPTKSFTSCFRRNTLRYAVFVMGFMSRYLRIWQISLSHACCLLFIVRSRKWPEAAVKRKQIDLCNSFSLVMKQLIVSNFVNIMLRWSARRFLISNYSDKSLYHSITKRIRAKSISGQSDESIVIYQWAWSVYSALYSWFYPYFSNVLNVLLKMELINSRISELAHAYVMNKRTTEKSRIGPSNDVQLMNTWPVRQTISLAADCCSKTARI